MDLLKLMLRRLLLLFTRIYRSQVDLPAGYDLDVIREFFYLVETNFSTLHRVKEYADKLNKSPKTLSNILRQNGNESPQQIIQERILLEAQKKLLHTNSNISDIGYELGFPNVQAFSRFFRSKTGEAPQNYREREILITI